VHLCVMAGSTEKNPGDRFWSRCREMYNSLGVPMAGMVQGDAAAESRFPWLLGTERRPVAAPYFDFPDQECRPRSKNSTGTPPRQQPPLLRGDVYLPSSRAAGVLWRPKSLALKRSCPIGSGNRAPGPLADWNRTYSRIQLWISDWTHFTSHSRTQRNSSARQSDTQNSRPKPSLSENVLNGTSHKSPDGCLEHSLQTGLRRKNAANNTRAEAREQQNHCKRV